MAPHRSTLAVALADRAGARPTAVPCVPCERVAGARPSTWASVLVHLCASLMSAAPRGVSCSHVLCVPGERVAGRYLAMDP